MAVLPYVLWRQISFRTPAPDPGLHGVGNILDQRLGHAAQVMSCPRQRVVLIESGLQGDLVHTAHQNAGLLQRILRIVPGSGAEQTVFDSTTDTFAKTAYATGFQRCGVVWSFECSLLVINPLLYICRRQALGSTVHT